MVEDYFRQVQKFNDLESSISSCMSSQDQIEKLQALKARRADSMLFKHKAIKDINTLQLDMARVEQELISL